MGLVSVGIHKSPGRALRERGRRGCHGTWPSYSVCTVLKVVGRGASIYIPI